MLAKTVNELVDCLTVWLGSGVWSGVTGYPHALPEPSNGRSVDRSPLFVVTASSGTYGIGESRATIVIGIQVSSDAKDPLKNYAYACKWLRDKIDAFGLAVYDNPRIFGCMPAQSFTWSLPSAQPRPVWQAQITIEFTLPGASRENQNFLI